MKKKGKYFFVSARDIYTEVFISGIQKKCGGDIHRKQGDQTQHEDDLFLLLGSCTVDSNDNGVVPFVGLKCDLKWRNYNFRGKSRTILTNQGAHKSRKRFLVKLLMNIFDVYSGDLESGHVQICIFVCFWRVNLCLGFFEWSKFWMVHLAYCLVKQTNFFYMLTDWFASKNVDDTITHVNLTYTPLYRLATLLLKGPVAFS